MSNSELHDELKVLVAEVIEIDDFNDDDNLVTQLDVDSMMIIEIVARIEERYRIRLREDVFTQLNTLNDVVRIVTDIKQPVNS